MRRVVAPIALLMGLAACGGAPPPIPNPQGTLEEGSALLAAGEPGAALRLLQGYDQRTFPKRLQPQYQLLLARAQLATGEPWDAYETIKGFADQFPHTDLRREVIEVEFEAGRRLSLSHAGFLFFWSDQTAARTVLEHLITRHPDNQYLADALRILGEMAYAEGRYQLAQERYRDLLRRRPESEWVSLARFRYAMSIFSRLQGPEYDLEQMQNATRELAEFLQQPPENPAFVEAARNALATLKEWQAERHVLISQFYRRVGNAPGERMHLQQAARDYPETDGGSRAAAMLSAMGIAPAAGAEGQ
jgi:outer membrane protein assembly factor BamD (BamD/ComL family)